MDSNKKILKFYLLTNTLKEKIRSGVSIWHIDKERLESVAEHVYGVCMLAIAIDSEYNFNIDINKVIIMLAIHELEECYIGDLTPFDEVSLAQKKLLGEEAVATILEGLIKKEKYLSLTYEYNDKQTKEAKFAHYCDKLEMMLQMKLYEDKGCSNLYKEENKQLLQKDWIQKLINNGALTVADLFFDYHMSNFEGNEIFENIAKLAQKNNLETIIKD